MKRFALLLLIVALILPGASAFAQDPPSSPVPPSPTFGQCDPSFWIDNFSRQLDTLQNLDDFGNLVIDVGQSFVDCGEEWLNMTLSTLLGIPLDDFSPSDPVAVDDGLLTPEDAEAALRAAISGDFEVSNQYFCEEEQATEVDVALATEGVEINSLKCDRFGEEMACESSLLIEGENYLISNRYAIVDELLCTILETEYQIVP
jgi:hypothetical protein